jgi:hypothetical protein
MNGQATTSVTAGTGLTMISKQRLYGVARGPSTHGVDLLAPDPHGSGAFCHLRFAPNVATHYSYLEGGNTSCRRLN